MTDAPSGLSLRMEPETRILTLSRNGVEVHREDFGKRLETLRAAYGTGSTQTDFTLTPGQLTFDSMAGDLRIRLIVRQIDGNTTPDATSGLKPGFAEGWLLVDLP